MANMLAIRCPECGARTNMDFDRKKCYCSYCGTELFFDNGSNSITYNPPYRQVNEVRFFEPDKQKEPVPAQSEAPNKHDKTKLIVGAILIISWLISFIVLAAISVSVYGNERSSYRGLLLVDIVLGLIAITVFFWGTRKTK